MNANIMRMQIFRKIKYDLKGYSLLTMVVQGHLCHGDFAGYP